MKINLKKWISEDSKIIRYYIDCRDVMISKDFYLDENKQIVINSKVDQNASNLKYRYDNFFKARNLAVPASIGEAIKEFARLAKEENKF
jgi:hypothetical protein